jgi:hypothetical protein
LFATPSSTATSWPSWRSGYDDIDLAAALADYIVSDQCIFRTRRQHSACRPDVVTKG